MNNACSCKMRNTLRAQHEIHISQAFTRESCMGPYALYIASLVFPTFDAYVFGKPAITPSNIESVTSAMTKSAIVICTTH